MDKYNELEQKGGGTADISGTWDFLKDLKTLSGRNPTDEELESSIKAMAGEDRTIDRRKFIELITKLKLIRN